VIARNWHILLAAFALLALTECTPVEPRPTGVGRGINFSVTPLYPKSFEITAFGSRLRDADELKEAWSRKAFLVANGRRFTATPLVVHNSESDYRSPLLFRSVTATITLKD
jgi:hypothetical protein